MFRFDCAYCADCAYQLTLIDQQMPPGSCIHLISEVTVAERRRSLSALYLLEKKGVTTLPSSADELAKQFLAGRQTEEVPLSATSLLNLHNCELFHHEGSPLEPALVAQMPVDKVPVILSTK